MTDRLAMLDAMIAKGSEDPFVFYARAMELRSRGDLPAALEAYQGVIARFPDYVPSYLMAGQVASQLGREAEARSALETGMEKARAAGDGKTLGELEAALSEL